MCTLYHNYHVHYTKTTRIQLLVFARPPSDAYIGVLHALNCLWTLCFPTYVAWCVVLCILSIYLYNIIYMAHVGCLVKGWLWFLVWFLCSTACVDALLPHLRRLVRVVSVCCVCPPRITHQKTHAYTPHAHHEHPPNPNRNANPNTEPHPPNRNKPEVPLHTFVLLFYAVITFLKLVSWSHTNWDLRRVRDWRYIYYILYIICIYTYIHIYIHIYNIKYVLYVYI